MGGSLTDGVLADALLIPPRYRLKEGKGVCEKSTETRFVSIGYSPEVCAFGNLITSTKVFSLIICKTFSPRPQNDPLPRDLRLCT